ncbi:Crp/Fnr family transcriptional regulator [Thiocapsa bogorovii]|uniref:Crp/Fnr family transcriptional regulator n=1 Tax=Thiocapsa bogorovii TaxID=521689 RepID=UPI001E447B01|nr:Crp/Fnr family transcriptional regulator [Thiocapsa bogorovii]UHD17225.1 Crp/Fnr family transcriptional regulator [Thiocapsa bogorovii]
MIGDPRQRQRLLDAFPFLQAASEEFQAEVFAHVTLVRLPVGQLISHDGDHCTQLPLVLTGTGRVYKLGENGREITLYRVHPGESCVVTTSCILSGRAFPAFAVCESAVEAVVVRPAEVRRWMSTSEPWREYIFGLIANRLQEVFGVLDAVLFQRLDQRLITHLLGLRATGSGPGIQMTHQALAVELGSSREVVSRVLKGLESQGLLRTTRGLIELLDIPALEVRSQEG